MTFELYSKPIVPANPAGLTTDELRRYLNVGRNNVGVIAPRFGIEKLHGIYPEVVVWRQLFGLTPDNDVALAALREPLANVQWVSSATGVPTSTIRDHLRSKRWQYDFGVQLGDVSEILNPRLRRWIPALIRSRRLASPAPSFKRIAPLHVHRADGTEQAIPPVETVETEPAKDLFSSLFDDADHASRQRRK